MKHLLRTTAALILATFAFQATALPTLQLGPELDPDIVSPADGWVYNDGDTDTWEYTQNPAPEGVTLNAYATDDFPQDAFENNADQTASLVVSLVNRADAFTEADNAGVDCANPVPGGCADAAPAGDIWVTGDSGALSSAGWEYGTAPLTDSNDLGPHGIFPSWFQIFEFNFDTAGFVHNTEDCTARASLGDTPDCSEDEFGWVEELVVGGTNFVGDYLLHIDLITMFYDDEGNQTGYVDNHAPYSHDALITVPEPSQLALFALGLFLMLGAKVRRSRVFS